MKGIIFSADSIKAIMEGRKTQTRRLGGLQELNREPAAWFLAAKFEDGLFRFGSDKLALDLTLKPRYQVGKVVYVKETWRPYGEKEVRIEYKDGAIIDYPERPPFSFYGCGSSWRSSLPAWAARTFIQIIEVRAERLQEMTEESAVQEGIEHPDPIRLQHLAVGDQWSPRMSYARRWDSINPKHPWASNPWVWVYSFLKVERP